MEPKDMSSFKQLVEERVMSRPESFLNHASGPSKNNPFSPEYKNTPDNQPPLAPNLNNQPAPHFQTSFEEKKAARAALKNKVDTIQVSLVMQMLGAIGNQDGDKTKWKIAGVGNIGVTGQKWFNLQEGKGGVGAVSLVIHALGIKYPEAIQWLATTFGESVDSDEIKASMDSLQRKDKKTFTPPLKNEKNISFVKHYLRFSRKLPEALIDTMIKQGRIYADNDKNCVFASEGIAELRSSFDGPNAVKQLVPGSSRKKGFMVLPEVDKNERTIAICESSIDALSYRAIYPGRAAISSAGVNPVFPRSIAEEAIDGGLKVIAAFDADSAGDKASQALFNHFYIKLWMKHKAAAELAVTIDDEDLFNLLNSNTVSFRLAQYVNQDSVPNVEELEEYDQVNPTESSTETNLLFFNQSNPFDDPQRPPTILLSIKKNEFGLPPCIDHPIPVLLKGYEFIVNKLGITRDRPAGEKDWNEVLKKRSIEQTKSTPTHKSLPFQNT